MRSAAALGKPSCGCEACGSEAHGTAEALLEHIPSEERWWYAEALLDARVRSAACSAEAVCGGGQAVGRQDPQGVEPPVVDAIQCDPVTGEVIFGDPNCPANTVFDCDKGACVCPGESQWDGRRCVSAPSMLPPVFLPPLPFPFPDPNPVPPQIPQGGGCLPGQICDPPGGFLPEEIGGPAFFTLITPR